MYYSPVLMLVILLHPAPAKLSGLIIVYTIAVISKFYNLPVFYLIVSYFLENAKERIKENKHSFPLLPQISSMLIHILNVKTTIR